MDVIALHQAGFGNAVAALGTSFTADHARLVARYADEATLIFDADSAGQKGTQRAISLLRSNGVHIRVVSIPDGKDPDEFIKKNGPERFRLLLERSANDVEYQLMELGRRHMLGTADGQVAYLREAADLLAGLGSPIERDVYAGKLAAELAVSKDAILQQVNYSVEKKRKQQKDRQLSANCAADGEYYPQGESRRGEASASRQRRRRIAGAVAAESRFYRPDGGTASARAYGDRFQSAAVSAAD